MQAGFKQVHKLHAQASFLMRRVTAEYASGFDRPFAASPKLPAPVGVPLAAPHAAHAAGICKGRLPVHSVRDEFFAQPGPCILLCHFLTSSDLVNHPAHTLNAFSSLPG